MTEAENEKQRWIWPKSRRITMTETKTADSEKDGKGQVDMIETGEGRQEGNERDVLHMTRKYDDSKTVWIHFVSRDVASESLAGNKKQFERKLETHIVKLVRD